MKKVIILALALVAGASLYPAEAAKKKDKIQAATPVVVPVQLATSSDSVSYAAGMNATNGLLPYLIQQQGVDTAYIADFIRGFQEVAQAGADPKMKAYAAGLGIATQVRDRMLPDIVKEFTDSPDSIIANLFFRGFTDALQKDTTVFTQSVADAFFSKKQRADKAAKEEKLYGPNRDAGEAFLAENAKKEGVVTTRSGLQYKVLVKGEGEVPQKTDKVQVHYEGRLIDGTVFDASKKHGDKPLEFRADQVIAGWTEALTMMPVGSKWQLYIPYKLAYGNRNQGEIKPYSALIFDVELVGIANKK
ncbi:MAG: FKBP-type peptidyl-prolyl cis-trans isomerase [Prevotella sp.]|jgi:FKBP-type peptidyl-prolyl cis-trans isomerase FklB|nr:FKBP-type peptidyl-prolyl cis-trans isomerase [Prevotella sp.]